MRQFSIICIQRVELFVAAPLALQINMSDDENDIAQQEPQEEEKEKPPQQQQEQQQKPLRVQLQPKFSSNSKPKKNQGTTSYLLQLMN